MTRLILLIVAFSLSLGGCAFYQKDYISKIHLEGKNYPGGDEGRFYIHNDPLIKISFSCRERTQLAATVFPLIPIPSFDEDMPHASIANQAFYMELTYDKSPNISPDTLSAIVQLGTDQHKLTLNQTEQVLTILPRYRYRYISDLTCKDIKKGKLLIQLNKDKYREYGIEFKEGVKRDVEYHLQFTT